MRQLDPQGSQEFATLALIRCAHVAYDTAQWALAQRAWQAVLEWRPNDPFAQGYLAIMAPNASQEERYKTIQDYINKNQLDLARAEWERLRQAAPYYGDPHGLAPRVWTDPEKIKTVQTTFESIAEKIRDDRRKARQRARQKALDDTRALHESFDGRTSDWGGLWQYIPIFIFAPLFYGLYLEAILYLAGFYLSSGFRQLQSFQELLSFLLANPGKLAIFFSLISLVFCSPSLAIAVFFQELNSPIICGFITNLIIFPFLVFSNDSYDYPYFHILSNPVFSLIFFLIFVLLCPIIGTSIGLAISRAIRGWLAMRRYPLEQQISDNDKDDQEMKRIKTAGPRLAGK